MDYSYNPFKIKCSGICFINNGLFFTKTYCEKTISFLNSDLDFWGMWRIFLVDKCKKGWSNSQAGTHLLWAWAPSGEWTPSGCCSQTVYGRPPAACRQRWDAAGLGGCPPCPGSWPWRSQWCLRAPPPVWSSCQSASSRRSACLHTKQYIEIENN